MLVNVVTGPEVERPSHLMVTWLSGRGTLFEGQRVPSAGDLPTEGPLAQIYVEIDASDVSDRKLLIRGMTKKYQACLGAVRIPYTATRTTRMTVAMHGSLPDTDGDGLPDAIDDCPTTGPCAPATDAGDAAGAAPADARSCGGRSPDVGPMVGPDAASGGPGDTSVRADAAVLPDTPPAVDLAAGLVAMWHMDEGAGTNVSDSSPNANDGILKKPVGGDWVSGRRGSAIAFKGSSWVSTPRSSSYDGITGGLSLAAWVLREADSPQYQVVVARQRGTGAYNSFWLGLDNGLVRFTVDDLPVESPAGAVPIGRWVHLCGTYDGETLRIFVDGKEVARDPMSPAIRTSMSGVTVGADINGPDPNVGDRFFNGRIDEVAIYGRALSAAEVALLAQ